MLGRTCGNASFYVRVVVFETRTAFHTPAPIGRSENESSLSHQSDELTFTPAVTCFSRRRIVGGDLELLLPGSDFHQQNCPVLPPPTLYRLPLCTRCNTVSSPSALVSCRRASGLCCVGVFGLHRSINRYCALLHPRRGRLASRAQLENDAKYIDNRNDLLSDGDVASFFGPLVTY